MAEHDSRNLEDHGGDCPWCGHKSNTVDEYFWHDRHCPESPANEGKDR